MVLVAAMSDVAAAFVLGFVEGATEFIPVSSTGHLILVGHLIGFTGRRAALFDIVIQLGAILAVLWHYRSKLATWTRQAVAGDRPRHHGGRHLIAALVLAFIPAGCVGLFAHRWITTHLFSPLVVAWAMILGGVAIERMNIVAGVHSVVDISGSTAVGIGVAQVISLIPGVSRSGATIMGAVVLRVDRPVAAEFSFLLAIPVMLAATGLGVFESASIILKGDVLIFGVGFVTAFVSALIALRLLLRYVSTHSFTGFAWYRIALGALLIAFGR